MIRKTKIVCTIGPASSNEAMLEQLILAGMNVARLNFSHGTHETHRQNIELIRSVAKRLNKFVGIMVDTKGPEIRVGEFEGGAAQFAKGDIVSIVREPVLGTNKQFTIKCHELFDDIEVGDYILIDDGKMRFDVIEKADGKLTCQVANPGIVSNHKGCNVPERRLSIPFMSDRDRDDLDFAIDCGIDLIAASFVREAADIHEIREILANHNRTDIQIIAKLENRESVDNLDEILAATDGIMVARGDLGVEISLQLVPIYQKKIIKRANELGTPVITATHMLESMIKNPRPTRAEASDVANAIIDGSDAIMLSGETAAGDYPLEAVQTMDTIARAIEEIIPYEANLQNSVLTSQRTINDAIGIAVAQSALTLPQVAAIVAFTETGGTAKRICKFRPPVPIIAITDNIHAAQQLTYYYGVYSALTSHVDVFEKYDEVAIDVCKKFGVKSGETIIITSGWSEEHGRTNTMRIIVVP